MVLVRVVALDTPDPAIGGILEQDVVPPGARIDALDVEVLNDRLADPICICNHTKIIFKIAKFDESFQV